MKGTISSVLAGLLMAFTLAACAKQPVQEINAAKSAVDAAIAEGAEKYSPAGARKVNADLAAALAEVNGQDGKFLKDYKKSSEMLAAVKAEAETLKAGLAARKQEAKNQALDALNAATSAVKEADAALAKAGRNKKAKQQLDALTAEAKGLDGDLLEMKNLITTEDYTTAIDKAGTIKEGAAALSERAGQLASAPKETKKKEKGRKKRS